MSDIRRFERENTVSAENQTPGLVRLPKVLREGAKRVLCAGNSITIHDPCADIGWNGCWGMAASAPEKDYVHLLQAYAPQADFGIAAIYDWERNFTTPEKVLPLYRTAADWNADVLIIRAGENTPENMLMQGDYALAVEQIVHALDPKGRARLIVTGLFWPNPVKEEALRRACERLGAAWVNLSDLGERDEMKAIGLFAHEGVAAHPGDCGMACIAERIWEKLRDLL